MIFKCRVILTKNGKYLKTLHKCQTRKSAFLRYRKHIEENKSVIFPKKFTNTKIVGVRPVEFKILVVKITESDDKFRVLRDKYGRTYTEKPIGIFTVLDDHEFNFEESFWIYGMNNKGHARPTIKELIKKITIGAYKKNVLKQIIVIHNKLVIYSEDSFDMILCKNKNDAQRLHHKLHQAAVKNKITGFTFGGTIKSKKMISDTYKLIMERTGWPKTKVMRYTNC